jgi:hypothetical protein
MEKERDEWKSRTKTRGINSTIDKLLRLRLRYDHQERGRCEAGALLLFFWAYTRNDMASSHVCMLRPCACATLAARARAAKLTAARNVRRWGCFLYDYGRLTT